MLTVAKTKLLSLTHDIFFRLPGNLPGYGYARSIIAMGTLLTLLFNDPNEILNPVLTGVYGKLGSVAFVNYIDLFKLSFLELEAARWIGVCCLLLVVSGWYPRITGLLHVWVSLSFINSAITMDGGDQIASNLSLLLLPICLCDDRKWHWNTKAFQANRDYENPLLNMQYAVANIFLFMIRLQMCVIYFHAAIGKMDVEEWRNGTAGFYWAMDPVFGVPAWLQGVIYPLMNMRGVVLLITWGSILLELFLFMAIVMDKKYYRVLLVSGIAFHFAIVLMHGLFSFFFSMAGGLMLYLYFERKQKVYVEKNITLGG